MATIDVSKATAGMVLSADVLDKRGRMLMPAGKELSEKHLGSLPAWGVTHIEIEGDDVAGAEPEVEPWAIDAAAVEIDRLFSKVNREHPLMSALAEACSVRKATQLQATRAQEGAS